MNGEDLAKELGEDYVYRGDYSCPGCGECIIIIETKDKKLRLFHSTEGCRCPDLNIPSKDLPEGWDNWQ